MPHLYTLSLRLAGNRRGQSPFARPVAAITDFARRLVGKAPHAAAMPRIAQDRDVRAREDALAGAMDSADLERLERAYDRRDAGGMRTW